MYDVVFLKKKNKYLLNKFDKIMDVVLSRVVGSDEELFGPMKDSVGNKYFRAMLRERMWLDIGNHICSTSTTKTLDEVLELTIKKNKLLQVHYLNSILYTVDIDMFDVVVSNDDLTKYIELTTNTVSSFRAITRKVRELVNGLHIKINDIPIEDHTGIRVSYLELDKEIDEVLTKGIVESNENKVIKELSFDTLKASDLFNLKNETYLGRRYDSLATGRIEYLFNKYIKDMSNIKPTNILKPRTRGYTSSCLDVIVLLRMIREMEDVGLVVCPGGEYDSVLEDNISALSNAYKDYVEQYENSADGKIIGYATDTTVEVFESKMKDINTKRLLGLCTVHDGVIVDGMLLPKHEELWNERLALSKLRNKKIKASTTIELIKDGIFNLANNLDDDTKELIGGNLDNLIGWYPFNPDSDDIGKYILDIISKSIWSHRGLDLETFRNTFKILNDTYNKLSKEAIIVLATNSLVTENLLSTVSTIDLNTIKGEL